MTKRKWPRKPGVAFRVAETILLPTLTAMSGRTWIDGDKIPESGGAIVVANHSTKIDPLTIAHFVHHHGRAPRFLAKAGIWDVPFVGWIMSNTKQIPVARMSSEAQNAFAAGEEALRDGECIVIYPEGTVTRDPHLWPMRGKTGAARMALATGVPVIPVAHWGEQEILPPYAKRPRVFPRKTIVVKAGDPVDLSDLLGGEITAEKIRVATDRIMAALTQLLEGLRGETAPAERFDPKAAGIAEIGNPNQKMRKKDQA